MQAIDTNVMIRYVTNDDPVQSPVAKRFVERQDIRVVWTVMLEAEWVLRSAYQLTRKRILFVIRQFIGLPNVFVDKPSDFNRVLRWFADGMDFADAMHLAACDEGETFASFDRKFVAGARKSGAGKVKAL